MSNPFYSFATWMFGGLKRTQGIQSSTPIYDEAAASTVTFDSAMQLSAVWACVKLLSETPASLPLNIYRKTPTGREVDANHYLSVLFSGKVNRYQNRVEFWETVLLNLLIHGNAYCVINRRAGKIVSLLPLMSSQVEVSLLSDGSITYQQTDEKGNVDVYAEQTIWHLKLMGNGITGLSPLAYQRNTLGIAQAAEKAVSNVYKNGAKPSGVLKLDRMLTKQQRDEVRSAFATLTTGSNNRLMVLEKGTDFQGISLSPQDIELLASRKFQISEICRWYGVPSVLVNDNNGTSTWGSGISQIMDGFYKLTLRPLLEKIEASMLVTLLSADERRYTDIEFDFDALLRSDAKVRFDGYHVAINAGVMTPNEARKMENLPEMDGGDQLLVQGALTPVIGIGSAPAAAPMMEQVTEELRSLRELTLTKNHQFAPAMSNISLSLDTPAMDGAIKSIEKMTASTLKQIREDMSNMNITVNASAELKQIPPIVNVYNEIKPTDVTVVDNHPKYAVQTVERDANDDIVKTITKFER